MRHNARFTYQHNLADFSVWFENELKLINDGLEVDIKNHKYDIAITIAVGKGLNEMVYSVFSNPQKNNSICIHVKPQLRFFDAILGKKDILREKATEVAHSILSSSAEITELGWYLERQAWKSPTMVP